MQNEVTVSKKGRVAHRMQTDGKEGEGRMGVQVFGEEKERASE